MTVPATHIHVLRLIIERVGDATVDWALTGSTGMAVQGMPCDVHDIDIQTDRAGAYQLGDLLEDFVVVPVRHLESASIRSYLGEYEVLGVQVEIMGAIEKLVAGTWEPPVDVGEHRRWQDLDGLVLPVLDLEYEVEAYTKMDRTEKAEKLRSWLAGREK